jgi:hypothetical protein
MRLVASRRRVQNPRLHILSAVADPKSRALVAGVPRQSEGVPDERQNLHGALPPRSVVVFGGCIDSGRADAERR